ncbi:MFS transporter [Calditerricola satsumensis]|uniref:MFS transporter n=1 Tax=Calditerricola satsumensis TaxID=373054 RepID=A0A8J3B914_9BACI|nr:MFS transporter [Calditerricola satsumensis]GGK04380.1 MFS transporter [Calditerricola satsumensis]
MGVRSTREPRALSWRLLGLCGVGLLFDAMEVGMLAFIFAALAKDWHLAPSVTGMLGSVNFIGMAIGAALAGLLADRFGRQRLFVGTLILYSLATGASAFAGTVAVLLALRFLAGMGLGGELPVATTYVLESAPESSRGRAVVYLNSFWAVGMLVAAFVSYFIIPAYGWQAGFLIGALPALYAVYLRRRLPETPAFQRQAARPPLLRQVGGLWGVEFRKRTAVLWLLWFAANFSYYGMFLWLPSMMVLKGYTLVRSFEYVLIMTLTQIPGYLSAAYLVERWGRKPTVVAYLLLAALSALGFGLSKSLGMLIAFGLALSFFNLGAWGAIYAFTSEQYPVRIRATGTGWAAGFGRVGSILAPYLVGLAISAGMGFAWIFGAFFAVMVLGALVVAAFGRESRPAATKP